METWRMIATVLLFVGGVVLVLVTMAKVRERTGSGSTVAISGAIGATLLVLLCVLTLTVLAPGIAWGAVIVVGAVGSTMLLVG
ncbi:hypothetical protein [Actinokineospora sp. HUAS TT18]|uniref:hypothetical protein n=1 Tax=Actinokineospora sp. HUAS TT18 TaxID=3447451 RepID=UPI003F51DBE7